MEHPAREFFQSTDVSSKKEAQYPLGNRQSQCAPTAQQRPLGGTQYHSDDQTDPPFTRSTDQHHKSPDQGSKTNEEEPSYTRRNGKIAISCLLIFIPMLAFNATILWLIFGHGVGHNACPYDELCPSDNNLISTTPETDYLVDFSAAKIVFIASWSSTASFSLISVFMALYTYPVAKQWLRYSRKENLYKVLPTPLQTSYLFRILNAEYTVLWPLFSEAYWSRDRTHHELRRKTTRILRASIGVFLFGITLSILIQTADTYLHLTTQAIDLKRLHPQEAKSFMYSRGLIPQCYEPPEPESFNENKDIWSCALVVKEGSLVFSRAGEAAAVVQGFHQEHEIEYYTDDNGDHIAVVLPKGIDQSIDWHASSLGVATSCKALTDESCSLYPLHANSTNANNTILEETGINCTVSRSNKRLLGNPGIFIWGMYYYDWNDLFEEPDPWNDKSDFATGNIWIQKALDRSNQTSANSFQNPWPSFSYVFSTRGGEAADTSRDGLINIGDDSLFVFNCETTVLDLQYTRLDNRINIISQTLSNSSTTSIASMPSADMLWYRSDIYSIVAGEIDYLTTSSQEAVDIYSRELSKTFLSSIAALTEPRPALHVQTRDSKVISKVSKAAVWSLLVSNMAFALFGFALAMHALRANRNMETTQVQIRTNVSGLIAQLFEGSFSRRNVKTGDELFEEHQNEDDRSGKRIAINSSSIGGTAFGVAYRSEV